MKKIITTLNTIFLAASITVFISCGNNLKLKAPTFTKDFNQTMKEIAETGNFSDVSFKLSTNQTNSEKPTYELDLKLFNGKNLPEDERRLDSIAKNAATIFKNSIQNINDYDWISIIFDSDDGRAVDITKKNVFVYRPNQLK